MAVDHHLAKVGEDQPFMEGRLPMAPTRPDLYEPLTALVEPGSAEAEEWWEKLVSTQEEGHGTHSLEKAGHSSQLHRIHVERTSRTSKASEPSERKHGLFVFCKVRTCT